MHPTINHATAHKKSAVLLMRIARGESVGILFGTPLRLTCHLLFPCLLYQSEFPTLFLAMREIIANASSVRISPRTDDKGTKKSDTPQGILEKYCAHKGTAPL